jgi:hypothetical protein
MENGSRHGSRLFKYKLHKKFANAVVCLMTAVISHPTIALSAEYDAPTQLESGGFHTIRQLPVTCCGSSSCNSQELVVHQRHAGPARGHRNVLGH